MNRNVAALVLHGVEGGAQRDELRGFADTLRTVTEKHGCGRAHVEWPRGSWAEARMGFLMLAPHWTDGCVPVTLSVYIQASPTSPSLLYANSRLLSQPRSGEHERPFDVAAGVDDLRMLGVRYFVASELDTVQAADAHPGLRELARTKPFDGRYWKIYEVPGVEVVEPLRHLPLVVPGSGRSRTSWEDLQERWYDSGEGREVLVAADGPRAWPRAERFSERPARRPVGGTTTVSRVRIENDRISFRVSRTGVPVLVKVSWFPNWEASGAEGPYRVTPNQMVVVPTSTTVTLRYGRSPVEYAGWAGTLAGLGGLVLLARRGPVDMPEPEPRPEPVRNQPTPRPRPQAGPKRKKRRR